MSGYWGTRQNLPYYAIVRRWLEDFGPCESLMDIGCHDTPVATWGDYQKRYTVDKYAQDQIPGVELIIGEWPDCRAELPESISVVTCLQVLEHVPEPDHFLHSLFSIASIAVIVSVPYKWAAGACKEHLHDPIDEDLLTLWAGRNPCESVITPSRLIAMYRIKDNSKECNTNL